MNKKLKENIQTIKSYVRKVYKNCFREPFGKLKHPFVVPGAVYANDLWDWDSWLTGLALLDFDKNEVCDYLQGSLINFLEHQDKDGRIPICISNDTDRFDLENNPVSNIHKPCIAQFVLSVIDRYDDYKWIEPYIENIEKYIEWYNENCKHETGLFFWINDFAVGVDNDPCVFYRPNNSCGSIFLNCMMYGELESLEKLENIFNRPKKAETYKRQKEELLNAINNECWDEKDGFYYSVDLNLLPVDLNQSLHSGCPRHWSALLMRIGVWSGFLSLYYKIASENQAKRVVQHLLNGKEFNSPFGIRSLSKCEKMYSVVASSNPSCWLGPVWILTNYVCFKGLLNYGYKKEARRLAEKTVMLLGTDIGECGEMHEYYSPETGKGVSNKGFQSWNLLSYEIALWLENN